MGSGSSPEMPVNIRPCIVKMELRRRHPAVVRADTIPSEVQWSLHSLNYRRRLRCACLLSALTAVAYSGCGNHVAVGAHENTRPEQILPLTFGGFLKDGPEAEQVSGVCGPDETRNLLNCDIYNGLPEWIITAVTLRVTWAPYNDQDTRDYDVPVVIQPHTTERVPVRLGMQLPLADAFTKHQRWGWLISGAKGRLAK